MEKFSLLGVEDELISRSLLRFSIRGSFFLFRWVNWKAFWQVFPFRFWRVSPLSFGNLGGHFWDSFSISNLLTKKGCQKKIFSSANIRHFYWPWPILWSEYKVGSSHILKCSSITLMYTIKDQFSSAASAFRPSIKYWRVWRKKSREMWTTITSLRQ